MKLGLQYLRGADGFPRNVSVGLGYLHDAGTGEQQESAQLIAMHLSLEELVQHKQLDILRLAAESSPAAQVKLASWCLVIGERIRARSLLDRAKAGGIDVGVEWKATGPVGGLRAALDKAAALQPMNVAEVALAAAQIAIERKDLATALAALSAALDDEGKPEAALQGPIVQAVRIAEETRQDLGDLPIATIQASLDRASVQGDVWASYVLGRASSGLNCGGLAWQRLVERTNLRKGLALLMRAADAGVQDAWLHLYRISSDYRCSVANPQMARFCLEKAAACGITEAERWLGALQMREAQLLADVEKALELLFRAGGKGDVHAKALMTSLVLPVEGSDADACAVIAEVQQVDPWLAMRLRLSRHFGLTKLEALSVNPGTGARPWGLIVDQNTFISQARLAAPRAIPAITEQALATLRQAAIFYSADHQDHTAIEGNLRKRSANQRRLFDHLRVNDSLFFAHANSSQRDGLRIGSRWAHRSRTTLSLALADAF